MNFFGLTTFWLKRGIFRRAAALTSSTAFSQAISRSVLNAGIETGRWLNSITRVGRIKKFPESTTSRMLQSSLSPIYGESATNRMHTDEIFLTNTLVPSPLVFLYVCLIPCRSDFVGKDLAKSEWSQLIKCGSATEGLTGDLNTTVRLKLHDIAKIWIMENACRSHLLEVLVRVAKLFWRRETFQI